MCDPLTLRSTDSQNQEKTLIEGLVEPVIPAVSTTGAHGATGTVSEQADGATGGEVITGQQKGGITGNR